MSTGPRVLIYDIETAPIMSYVWGLFDQNVGLNQIHKDWHLLSWSAKWLGDPANKVMYMDQRGAKNIEDDRKLLEGIWKLLDEADAVITQNGKEFDHKKLQARFVINGMQPPSSYQHIDTLKLARKHFGFTSNKLEYMTEKLCKKYKKLKSKSYPGFELWRACLAGDLDAWKEMERYNKHDVLALEELYYRLIPWDNTVNFNLYGEEGMLTVCTCGPAATFKRQGFAYTTTGKFQRYKCTRCGSETRGRTNLLSKEQIASLRVGTKR